MSDELNAAVNSLEASRSALVAALVKAPTPQRRHYTKIAGAAAPVADLWNVLWKSMSEAAGEQWQRNRVLVSLELARPVVADAVRRQPWTAVAVAGLCGAVVVWVVSTRRRLLVSAGRLWWRTAGMAILTSAAFKFYEQYATESDPPAQAPDRAEEVGPMQED